MKYYVYLIISYHKKKLVTYVGYTNNIKNRLKLHNTSKGAKFTKGKKWEVLYKKAYKTKSIAMKSEYLLKKNKKKRDKLKNDFIIKKNSQ
tara:strand:+ start:42 stop:311 length:270 start_codon:yes stop_codon:yes gene_type:complete